MKHSFSFQNLFTGAIKYFVAGTFLVAGTLTVYATSFNIPTDCSDPNNLSNCNISANFESVSVGGTQVIDNAGNADFTSILVDGNPISGGGNSVWTESDSNVSIDNKNVGIGTSSPSKQLTIDSGTPSSAGLAIKSSHSGISGTGAGDTTGYIIPLNNGLSIDAKNNNGTANQPIYIHYDSAGDTYINHNGGNVGIGTSAPLSKLDVNGNIVANSDNYPSIYITNSGKTSGANGRTWGWMNYGSGLYLSTYQGTDTSIAPGGPSHALFVSDSNQYVGIGTTSPSAKLHVAGNINANGTTYTSDKRYKTNIIPLTSSLKKIQKIQGVTYDWRQDAFPEKNFGEDKQIGVIAQEVEKVLPELVTIDQEGYKSVSYIKLIPILLEGIKEQQEQLNILRDEIEELKK